MTLLRQLHSEAMDLAEEAQAAKLAGKLEESRALFHSALSLEAKAASLSQTEPSRAILHRSAAELALECYELREAERLAAVGLAGSPPSDIAYELRDIISRANFHMHLGVRGEVLSQEQLQLTLDGDVVSDGIVLSNAFIQKVNDLDKLVFRTGQRKREVKFEEKPARRKKEATDLSLYLKLPRAGTYSITLQVGIPPELTSAPLLPGISDASEVIDDLMYCLDLVNTNNQPALRKAIPDAAYYNNFIGVSKRFAPDGSQIKLVGLTRIRGQQEVSLALTTPQNTISFEPIEEPEEKKGEMPISQTPKVVEGFLRFADSVQGNQIKIVPEGDERGTTFIVPEGYMDDIVRPLWNTNVTAVGYRIGRTQKYKLINIEPAD